MNYVHITSCIFLLFFLLLFSHLKSGRVLMFLFVSTFLSFHVPNVSRMDFTTKGKVIVCAVRKSGRKDKSGKKRQ